MTTAGGGISPQGVGGEADAIEKEVIRRCSQGIHSELIKPMVQDAIDRRRPRW
jgi:hypothetical protein